MTNAGGDDFEAADCATSALTPPQHAVEELAQLENQPGHEAAGQESYAEQIQEDTTYLGHAVSQSSGQQLLQHEPTNAVDPAAELHQALLEQQQDDSNHTLLERQQSSSHALQQQEQALSGAEQRLPRSAGSSPVSIHTLQQQQQQLLELQHQWAEQEEARLQRLAGSLGISPNASQQQQQDWQHQQQQQSWQQQQQQQDWQQQQKDRYGIDGAVPEEFASGAAAAASASPDSSCSDSGDSFTAAGELDSPASLFLPPGSLTSSLQFALSPPRLPASPAAALCESPLLRIGLVRSSPPLSPTPAAAAAAVAAAAPAAARQSLSALQLRCQALEVSLEQQAQQAHAAQAAVSAAHAAHSAEQDSMRHYYEAQLLDRQAELQLLMQHLAAAAARTESAATTTADGGGSTVVIGAEESLAAASIEVHHPSPLTSQGISSQGTQQHQQHHQQQQQHQQRSAIAAAQAAAAAAAPPGSRPLSPTLAAVAANAGFTSAAAAGGAAGGMLSSSVSLTDVALLRRELGQAEGLLQAYQAENVAAARRIKELESQLSSARAELADEAGRAQRAVAAAAETQRASGSTAADRLARQLQLEGQVEQMQASWQERERSLLAQVEALRRDKAAAAARAAAAAEGHDMAQWQADYALVAELHDQLQQQAAEHAAQLHGLQEKLAWYAENQALLGNADQLVAQQADLIRQLEARLAAAEGAAGRSQAARIAELQQQVQALQEALASRHPSSVPGLLAAAKPGPAEAAALAAAASSIQQLEVQLGQQQASHEACLRQLQQQYEALKARLEQKSAAQQAGAGSKSRVRELTQQLEEQRSMYTRRIRTLEARLTAAEGAAAAASRRGSAGSSSGGFRGGRAPAAAAAGSGRAAGLRGAGQAGRGTTGARGGRHGSSQAAAAGGAYIGSDGDHAVHDAVAAADSEGKDGLPGEGSLSAGAAGRPAVAAGLLRVRERQMAGIMAQLEERTSQYLQLQQKYRAAERQLKALTAGQQQQQQQSDGDSSERGSPPARPDVAAAQDASPHQQQQRHAAAGSLQHRKRIGVGGAAAAAGGSGGASWPALCAELEGEVEGLKDQLARAHSAAQASQQQVAELTHYMTEQKQQATAGSFPQQLEGLLLPSSSLPPAPYLLSVAEEAAAREAARWEPQLEALQEMLRVSQAEAAALSQELAIARAGRGSSNNPSLAAFEALEANIASLEAAAGAQRQQAALLQQQQQQQQLAALLAGLTPAGAGAGAAGLQQLLAGLPGAELLSAVSQQYEAALAAKAAELEGFRLQLDGLLGAARQLQQERAAGEGGSAAVQQ